MYLEPNKSARNHCQNQQNSSQFNSRPFGSLSRQDSRDSDRGKNSGTSVQPQRVGFDFLKQGIPIQREAQDTARSSSLLARLRRSQPKSSIQRLALSPTKYSGARTAIQRYEEVKVEDKQYRISQDRTMIVYQRTKYGSHKLWAKKGKAEKANQELERVNSYISLHETSNTKRGKMGNEPEFTVYQIEPRNRFDDTSGDDMKIYADCGKSSRRVMGVENSKSVKAVFKGKDREKITQNSGPRNMKEEILVDLIKQHENSKNNKKKIMDWRKFKGLKSNINNLEKELKNYKKKNKKKNKKKDKLHLNKVILNKEKEFKKLNKNLLHLLEEAFYSKISKEERTELEKRAKINEWAQPDVGQGFNISTSMNNPKKSQTDKLWNFHWAGVVMKSDDGKDRVTLENYATGRSRERNNEWEFQMYGPGENKEQTFHSQHKKTDQHGKRPTTMHVKPQ